MDTANSFPDAGLLLKAGEPFAAGFCECPEAAPFGRCARAYRRWFEQAPLAVYGGGQLYPGGLRAGTTAIMAPWNAFTFRWDQGAFDERRPHWDASTAETFQRLQRLADEEAGKIQCLRGGAVAHSVGGAGYTHAIVNYGRVLAEGLDAYEARVCAGLDRSADESTRAFHAGLIDLLAGIRAWHARVLEYLRASPPFNGQRDRLIAALSRVPFQPARSFYEVMVGYNFVYYLDDCDNPGRLDAVLSPYYQAAPDRAAAIALLGEFADNVSANAGCIAHLQAGTSVPVRHWIELIDESLGA